MLYIKIIKTPIGEAPLWVREAWLKCRPIPLAFTDDEGEGSYSLLSKKPVLKNERRKRCYFVSQSIALEALEKAE